MAELPELMTLSEVAKLLRITTRTVRRWIEEGELPALNVTPVKGRRGVVRVRREDVMKMLHPVEPEIK